MKLGPLEINLARYEKNARLPEETRKRNTRVGSELGATGTNIFGGLLTEQDYNADLDSSILYDVYDRMRRSDGQVRAGLSAIKLPLLRAEWKIEPASSKAKDREIAERLHKRFFHEMTIPWAKLLRQILMYLDYGSMPFEKVWEVTDDGLVMPRKLAQRLPRSILRWEVDEYGGLSGIQQLAIHSSGTKPVDIPVDKLLVFVNELEGSNYRGVSVLRAAYKHWFYKDKFYIIDAITKEKRGVGVDVGTLKGDVTEERRKDAESALMRIHGHEKMFLTEIEDEFSYRVAGIEGRLIDALSSIEHHDVRILRSILAEFLAMGEKSSQGNAMHRDKTSLFTMSLGAIGKDIIDCVDEYFIKQWVDYNWEVDEYPHLTHSRLETRDVQQLAGAIARLVSTGSLTADTPTENTIREILELPEIDPDSPRPVPIRAAVGGGTTPSINPPSVNGHKNGKSDTADKLDQIIKNVNRRLDPVRSTQVSVLRTVGENALSSGNIPERLKEVTVPYQQDARRVINDALEMAFVEGFEGEISSSMIPESERSIWKAESDGLVKYESSHLLEQFVLMMTSQPEYLRLFGRERDFEDFENRLRIRLERAFERGAQFTP